MPGRQRVLPVKSVSRSSSRARRSSAISCGSLCAANCLRAASGEVQKAYSASVMTSCARGN